MGQQRKALTPERSLAHRWGWELRNRRDQAGLSLAGLGRLVTFDSSYLARLERSEQFPSEGAATACDTALDAGGELIRLRAAADAERRQAVQAATLSAVPASAASLPTLDPDAACPKCAGAVVSVAYHAGMAAGSPCAAPGGAALGEHLCRGCQRCGYGWPEATADSAPARSVALRLVSEPRGGRSALAGA